MFLLRYVVAIIAVLLVWFVFVFTPIGPTVTSYTKLAIAHAASYSRALHIHALQRQQDPDFTNQIIQAQLDVLKTENQEMRQLLNFKERSEFKGVGAQILTRTPHPIREEVVIDRGSDDGVIVGAPVIAGDGVLVGLVIRADQKTSIIRLLIDPLSKIAGRMLNTDQSEGIVTGGHGIVVRMELIPRDEVVTEGMQMVTSGLDELIDRGLLIGEVVTVEPDPNSLFIRAIATPPVDYDRLTHVLVGVGL